MTGTRLSVAAAELDATIKRERLSATARELQAKLNPTRIAKQAVVDATVAGEAAAIASVDTVRRNPGAAAGMVAVAGLFLARHRIAQLFGRGARTAAHDDTPQPVATDRPDPMKRK